LIFGGELILGETIQLEKIGNDSGILYGVLLLKVESRELKLSAKNFQNEVFYLYTDDALGLIACLERKVIPNL
jgi:hypothetical protein